MHGGPTDARARLALLLALAAACAAQSAPAQTPESARRYVQESVEASLRIVVDTTVTASGRARSARALTRLIRAGLDAERFGEIALGPDRFAAAFTGAGPRCVYSAESLHRLRARYGDLVARELADLALDHARGLDPASARAQPGHRTAPGHYVVRFTVRERGARGSRSLALFLVWREGRFRFYDLRSGEESLAEFLGSGHRALFERNRNDPARSLHQRGVIDRAADYRPSLEPGETRCR